MNYNSITFTRTGEPGLIRTASLGLLRFSLQIDIGSRHDLDPIARDLLRHVGHYFMTTERSLVAGETVDWASALLVARQVTPELFEFDEMDFDGETVNHGVTNTLEIWKEQGTLCKMHRAQFEACHYGEQIAISPGLLESVKTIEGIRYKKTPSMSGWWLFTEDYDGTVDQFKSMQPTHVFHVVRARRDLARYFGLPAGFAFSTAMDGSVWYEGGELTLNLLTVSIDRLPISQ